MTIIDAVREWIGSHKGRFTSQDISISCGLTTQTLNKMMESREIFRVRRKTEDKFIMYTGEKPVQFL